MRMHGLRLAVAAVALVGGLSGCAAGSEPVVGKAAGTTSPKSSTVRQACPPVGDATPSWRVTLPKPARQLGKTVGADIDGDGRNDAIRLMAGWRTAWDGDIDVLAVRFAGGSRARVQIPDFEDLARIAGTADVNADGRAEVIVVHPGNTSNSGDVATLVRHRLMLATSCMFDAVDGWYRASPLKFWAHSNGCLPWCDETTACRYVDGAPRLITVDGSTNGARRRWTVTLYRLAGADLVKTATYRGSVRGNEALPRRWPFLDALSCGTARYPV